MDTGLALLRTYCIVKESNEIGQIRSRGGAAPIHQIGVGLVFQRQPLDVTASMWWTGSPIVKDFF